MEVWFWRSAMSRILKNVHKSAARLHDAGYMERDAMRKFDALYLDRMTLGDDLIEAMRGSGGRLKRAKGWFGEKT
jgi:hypothetical protein